jgi:hypothetical protein
MQRNNWIFLGCIAVFLTASFLALQSSSSSVPAEKTTCCKKIDPECIEKNTETGEMLPESLSRQFISIIIPVN